MAVKEWTRNNFLKLNEDKTDILLAGPKTKREMSFQNLVNLTPWVRPEVLS